MENVHFFYISRINLVLCFTLIIFFLRLYGVPLGSKVCVFSGTNILVPLKLILVALKLFLVPLKIQTFEPNGTPYIVTKCNQS